jgi:hypothetical protein
MQTPTPKFSYPRLLTSYHTHELLYDYDIAKACAAHPSDGPSPRRTCCCRRGRGDLEPPPPPPRHRMSRGGLSCRRAPSPAGGRSGSRAPAGGGGGDRGRRRLGTRRPYRWRSGAEGAAGRAGRRRPSLSVVVASFVLLLSSPLLSSRLLGLSSLALSPRRANVSLSLPLSKRPSHMLGLSQLRPILCNV